MENEIILLQEIKSAIWILIYLIGISVALTVIRVLISVYKAFKEEAGNKFSTIADAMYENEEFEELIEYCNNYLKENPKEGYAYWFLGKTYFYKKQYQEASRNFKKAQEINPFWAEKWTGPYLKQIEAATETSNNLFSPHSANNAPPG